MNTDLHHMSRTDLRAHYNDYIKEDLNTLRLISLPDLGETLGLFKLSDYIIMYDTDDMPVIVTERIHRKNFTWLEWMQINRVLRRKLKYQKAEYGFEISVTYTRNYIDYTNYKEYWLTWAEKMQRG